jgi:hypothetical protein
MSWTGAQYYSNAGFCEHGNDNETSGPEKQTIYGSAIKEYYA